ncbi:MAG TPA: isoprenylcysteine carboxylmethyltransferase family protein [Bryobacteraceae bacterium]|jgi:protein-S-isoprenylcysteine O-methyltransferase Ste14|nr:isoprenylcysteine carboxylmethyltransferase family protein [Bryobacteraceae bacterium]
MIRVELLILSVFWVAFYIYWLVSAKNAKRNVRPNRAHAAYRILIIVIILPIFFAVRRFEPFVIAIPNPPLGMCGLILCALGLSLAVWARKYLGKNWGMPMSVKEDPELVTTGPYRYVRHPIYSGILLAMLGSALVSGVPWLVVFVCYGIYFAISARAEERLILREFPQEYPKYRAATKAIIPFVW